MIITFWSPIKGQSKTTSNSLAVAVSKVMQEGKKVLLVNCSRDNTLEHALVGNLKNHVTYLNDIGIDGLSKLSKIEEINQETIKNVSISFLGDCLHFMPGTMKSKEEFELNIKKEIPNLIEVANKYYDYVIVDLPSKTKLDYSIFNVSSLKVICLPQNKKMISYAFERYQCMFDDKTLYMIGGYDSNSSYNVRNLVKIYPKLKGKLATIPYDINYLDALSNSKAIEFLQKNNLLVDEKGSFTDKVKEATSLIVERKG